VLNGYLEVVLLRRLPSHEHKVHAYSVLPGFDEMDPNELLYGAQAGGGGEGTRQWPTVDTIRKWEEIG